MATESGEAADPAPVEAAVDICDLPRDALYDILARADPRGAAALASACRRLRETTAFPGAERTWREVALRSLCELANATDNLEPMWTDEGVKRVLVAQDVQRVQVGGRKDLHENRCCHIANL